MNLNRRHFFVSVLNPANIIVIYADGTSAISALAYRFKYLQRDLWKTLIRLFVERQQGTSKNFESWQCEFNKLGFFFLLIHISTLFPLGRLIKQLSVNLSLARLFRFAKFGGKPISDCNFVSSFLTV